MLTSVGTVLWRRIDKLDKLIIQHPRASAPSTFAWPALCAQHRLRLTWSLAAQKRLSSGCSVANTSWRRSFTYAIAPASCSRAYDRGSAQAGVADFLLSCCARAQPGAEKDFDRVIELDSDFEGVSAASIFTTQSVCPHHAIGG